MISMLAVLFVAASVLAAPQLDLRNGDLPQPAAAPRSQENDGANSVSGTPVSIISQTYEVGNNGTYNFSFESSDGTQRQESGYLKYNVPPPSEGAPEDYDGTAQVAQGSYSYIAPDGVQYTLKYIADENGFRVEGNHLPKVPTGTGVGSSQGNTNLDGSNQPPQDHNLSGHENQPDQGNDQSTNQGNDQGINQGNGLGQGNGISQGNSQGQGNGQEHENNQSQGNGNDLGIGFVPDNGRSEVSGQDLGNGLEQGNGNVGQGIDFSHDNAAGGVGDQGTGEPSLAAVSPTQLTAGSPTQEPTVTPTQDTTGLTEIL